MTTRTRQPRLWAGALLVLCLVPFGWGYVVGLLVTPFVAGYKLGREVADTIAEDAFGDGVSEDK